MSGAEDPENLVSETLAHRANVSDVELDLLEFLLFGQLAPGL